MKPESADRLQTIRGLLQLSTYGIAKELGISQAQYSRKELGKTAISIEMIVLLHKKFKVRPNFLCLGENPIFERE